MNRFVIRKPLRGRVMHAHTSAPDPAFQAAVQIPLTYPVAPPSKRPMMMITNSAATNGPPTT